jgi:hypothetical protein
MRILRRSRIVSGLLPMWLGVAMLCGSAWGQSTPTPPPPEPQPPALDGPTTGAEALPPADAPRTVPSAAAPAPGDPAVAGRVYAPKAPPSPIIERPSGVRPDRNARWIAGYWDWDTERDEYVWVGGSWQIPPAGSIWVAGRWDRDAAGWYWIPGQWSRRGNPADVAVNGPRWRTTGPPADHPDDEPAPAPGPDFFFVPGHYAPDGDRLAWKPGFWSRSQPGWDWIPSRWVRRANGWDFREGYWVRDPDAPVVVINPRARRRIVARPPVVVETVPGAMTRRDPIAADEETDAIIGSVAGPTFYMIRPPGMYPYGPGGVVVPDAVPPFVRRLLDRVLP